MDNISAGSIGEGVAASYLRRNGYRILEKNWRTSGGEIDIIARAPNGVLVFCEVKTLVGHPLGLQPEDNLTKAKMIKMKRAAKIYVAYHEKMLSEDAGWRMDMVAVVMGVPPEIRHYENVF